jgi:hypothetical protein
MRRQLFEFNDQPWVPKSLRDVEIEALGRLLEWGGVIDAVAPAIASFAAESETREILDLCGGSGVPARILCHALAERGAPVERVFVSDLFPRVRQWSRERSRSGGKLELIEASVDAADIPAELSRGRTRVILNAFHHFPAQLAIAILRDAVEDEAPIFIAEPFPRQPRATIRIAMIGWPALMATPLLTTHDRLRKIAWTWLTPVATLASAWDVLVSTLREWNEDELRAMVAPFGSGYDWRFGTYDFAFGRGTYFCGRPREARA